MSLLQKYKKSLEQKWRIRFKTNHPDGDTFDGIVTHIAPNFIIMREEWDFEFNGIVLLQKKNIKGYRDGKYEACFNAILQQNGQMKKLRVPRWLDSCKTIPQVIQNIKQHNIWPIIERLFNEGKETDFYIGPITEVSDESFSVYCYDAAGEWESEYKIRYEEIFRVEFDSKYCKHFNSYMRNKTK